MPALDHAIVLSHDLDQAAPIYRRLGFQLTPRGGHPSLGTANHTIVFDSNYLELLSVVARGPGNERWARLLDAGEGPASIVFATDDVSELAESLGRRGVEAEPPLSFSRPVAVESGHAQARFTAVMLGESASPAVPAFWCQHHTRDLVWMPDYRTHANTATGIVGLTVLTDRPRSHYSAYERLLGPAAVRERPGGVTLDLGRTQTWLLSREYVQARLKRGLDRPAGLIGLTVSVTRLEITRQVLVATAVPYQPFGRRSILVEPTFTCGAFLEFVESA